jgi:uncharacterized membrane protein YeaQ/YmgE (transglycosylase-associated protein family)
MSMGLLWNFIVWAVFGLLAGIVAKFIGRQPERFDLVGLITTCLLGILGAVVGGWISSMVLNWDPNTISLAGFAVAVGGALLLLLLYRLFMMAVRKKA